MIDQVRPAALSAWIAQAQASDAKAVVLDVREAWELQTASVQPEGFALMHIPMGELGHRLAELDPTHSIACLCHHGGRSQRVALFLEQQGFTRLANVAGGINAWAIECDHTIPRY